MVYTDIQDIVYIRPREKINFSTPTAEFSNIFANIAFAIGFYWAKAIVGKQLSFDLENQYKQ